MFEFLKKKQKHSEAEFMLKANEELLKRRLAASSSSNQEIKTKNEANFSASRQSSASENTHLGSSPSSNQVTVTSQNKPSNVDLFNDLSASSDSARVDTQALRDVDYYNLGESFDNSGFSSDEFSFSSAETLSSANSNSQALNEKELLNELLEEIRMLRSQNDYILSILKRLEKKLG